MTAVLEPATRTSSHPSLWTRTPNRPDDWFDREALAEARAYARPLNRLRLLSSALGIVTSLLFVLLQLGPELVEWLDVEGWVLQLLVVLIAFELVDLLYAPAISGYVQLVYDKRHGLSTQTPRQFAVDIVKNVVLSIVLFGALLTAIYAIIRSVDTWWIWAWLVFVAFTLVMAFVYPVAIMPRFNKFVPLEDGELRRRIEAVAQRAAERIQGVYTMDASRRTRRDNAFVAGFGATKRVVLFDTILEHPPETIEQVVAHEIGHYRLKHVQKSVVFQAALMFAVFAFLGWFTTWDGALDRAGVDSIEDPASLPLLLVGLGIAFKIPGFVGAWYSRAKERQADLEALELLGDPDAFVDVWRRFAPKNKMELEPPWWKRLEATHPEVSERMQFGAEWRRQNPDVQPVTSTA